MRIPKILASFSLLLLLATTARAEQVSAQVILKNGDPAPGTAGLLVTAVQTPFTNDHGMVGFTGTVSNGGNDPFVWYNDQVVYLFSEELAFTLATIDTSSMGISNAGDFVFRANVNTQSAIVTNAGAVFTRRTEQAPGFVTGATITGNNRPIMAGNGIAHWISNIDESGGTTSDGQALYRATDPSDPGSVSLILRFGDVVGGFAIQGGGGVNTLYDFSDDASHHLHVLLLETGSAANDGAMYVDGVIVAREGDPTSDGDNWGVFDKVAINNNGDYVYSGDTDGDSATDEFIAVNDVIQIREGDTLDGFMLATGTNVRAVVAINNLGNVAHLWSVGNGNTEALFASHISDLAGTATLLLSRGDTLDINGDLADDFVVSDFAATPSATGPGLDLGEDGFIFVEVVLDTVPSTSAALEAIIRIPFPVSGAVALEVNTLEGDDDGDTVTDLSLPEAIRVANSGDTITFNSSLDGGIIQLDSTLVVDGKDLTIIGPGPFVAGTRSAGDSSERLIPADTGLLIVAPGSRRTAINDRHMFVDGGSTLNISGMTFMGGQAQGGDGSSSGTPSAGGGAAGMGGSFFINSGNVSLDHCDFDNNAATGGNGGSAFIFGSPGGGGGGGIGSDGSGTTGGNGGPLGGVGGVGIDGQPGTDGGEGAGGGGGGNGGGGGGMGGYGGGGGGANNDGTVGGAGGFGGGGGGGANNSGGAGGLFGGDGGGSLIVRGGVPGGGGGGGGLGGALFLRSGSLTISNSNFTNNSAAGGTGGTGSFNGENGQGKGGAIFVDPLTGATLSGSGNAFSGNAASDDLAMLNIDDDNIFYAGAPLAVELESFSAIARTKFAPVKLEWVTSAEIDLAGFNVFRAERAERSADWTLPSEPINRELIAGEGSPNRGARYNVADERWTHGQERAYFLVDIDLSGRETIHGPVFVEYVDLAQVQGEVQDLPADEAETASETRSSRR